MGETATISSQVSAAYDRIAADYAVRNAAMPPTLIDLAERLLKRIGPAARVLDVGCGAGRDMAWLEDHGLDMVGIDASAGMLMEARTRVRGALLRMDMRALAFAGNRFDGVWCVASLLHLPKSDAHLVLGELRRILVPGGTLVLSLQQGTGEVWESDPYGKGARRFFTRYSRDEATSLLIGAGFTMIERGSEITGTRHWLFFLAGAGGEEGYLGSQHGGG